MADTTTQGASLQEERERFEAVFSVPPYEFDMARWPYNHLVSWPGHYRKYHVQCAWEAWQARAHQ